jgi:hypothetical protein
MKPLAWAFGVAFVFVFLATGGFNVSTTPQWTKPLAAPPVSQSEAPAAPDPFYETLDDLKGFCNALADFQLTEPCSYSTWSKTITISVLEPWSDICEDIANTNNDHYSFPPGWSLRVLSPYSGGHPVATCDMAITHSDIRRAEYQQSKRMNGIH